MKNVLLLCLSPLNPRAQINKYSYEANGHSFQLEGIMTNEAPTKAVIKMLSETGEGEHLDKIVLICSTAVLKKITLKTGENAVDKHLETEDQVDLDHIREDTHLNLFKRVIKNYSDKIDNYYSKAPIEYIEIPIADFTEDYEVSEAVIKAAECVTQSDEKVQLFIDFNGGQRYVAFMILAIANLMKIREVNIAQIMTMNFDNKVNNVVPIQNMKSVFDSFDLIAGINEYVNYGRIKGLRNYFEASNNQEIKSVIEKMEVFANNLQLCRTGYVMENREELLRILRDYSGRTSDKKSNDTYEQVFEYVVEDILKGYDGLLNGELPDIISWCVSRDFIQQALTFCAEEMPGYFWRSGIFKASPLEKQEYDHFLKEIHKAENRKNPLRRNFRKEHQTETSKYAYEWIISYLPYSQRNEEYKKVLIDTHESWKRLIFTGPKAKDLAIIKNHLGMFRTLDFSGIRLSQTLVDKAKNSAAPLIWHSRQNHGRAHTNKKNRNEFEEIMMCYFLLKEQRNLTNHADGESDENDTWTYDELCKGLKVLVKAIS